MEIVLEKQAKSDLDLWKTSGNKQVLKKIDKLIDDIIEHPETGMGKPEQLRYEFTGLWSRHINEEHRMIYEIVGNELHIVSVKGHYE
jgi:toxin YoeB